MIKQFWVLKFSIPEFFCLFKTVIWNFMLVPVYPCHVFLWNSQFLMFLFFVLQCISFNAFWNIGMELLGFFCGGGEGWDFVGSPRDFWALIFLPIRSSPSPSVEIGSTPWDFSPLLRIIPVGLASNYPACWLKEWGAYSFWRFMHGYMQSGLHVGVLHHKPLDFI